MVVLLLWKHGYDKPLYPVYHELKGCYQSASASFIVSPGASLGQGLWSRSSSAVHHLVVMRAEVVSQYGTSTPPWGRSASPTVFLRNSAGRFSAAAKSATVSPLAWPLRSDEALCLISLIGCPPCSGRCTPEGQRGRSVQHV